MQSEVKPEVLVGCRGVGTKHSLVRFRRYRQSESDGIWVRMQGDDEWFLRMTEEGLEAYPRPEFDCPKCPHRRVFEHDAFQRELQQAASGDGLLLI